MMMLTGRKGGIVGIMLIEHLGDIVACEPVARHLRRKYPDAHVVWCVRSTYRDLVRYHPDIDSVIMVHCLSVKDCLKKSGLFTVVADLHFNERFCSLCHSRPPFPVKRESDRITLKNFYSFGNILQSFSLHAGLGRLNEPARIWIPESSEVLRRFSLRQKCYIIIHCSSNTPEKEWSRERWQHLVDRIIETTGCSVAEIGLSPVVRSLHKSYVDACGMLSIPEMVNMIRGARFFIGIDSGPAHIANCLDVPGIILMGTYLGFSDYMPYSGGYSDGSNAIILRSSGTVAEISVEQVINAVDKSILLMNQ